MLGDLIDLATPTGTPIKPHYLKQQQQQEQVYPSVDDVFSFPKPDQSYGSVCAPPCLNSSIWAAESRYVSKEGKASMVEGGPDKQHQGVDQYITPQTPRLVQANTPQMECPPTCPLQIPPTPEVMPTPASTAANIELPAGGAPLAFNSTMLAAAASEEREAAPATLEHVAEASQRDSGEDSCTPGYSEMREAVATEEQPCPSSSSSSSSSRDAIPAHLQKEIADLRSKLAKVEGSRDSIARDLGHQKGNLAKLEGTVSSLDKRLKVQLQENQALKVRLAEAERAAAAASEAVDVTPERCRSSVKAMQEEALRAQGVARQREAQVHKLQQLMAHEAEEMAQLQAFESQERTMLLASQASLQQALAAQGDHVAALLQQQGQSREREAALEVELHKLKKEVWDTKNQNIELVAEAQHMHGVASAAQTAATAAQQQAAASQEAEARCAVELTTVRDAGVKLFKQIRAVVHALERNLHHFQKVPEVGLSIRQLHDWCAKHGPFWAEKGEEALAASSGAAAGQPSSQGGGPAGGAVAPAVPAPGGHGQGGLTASGDETMTISLGHVMALGAGGARA